MQQRNQEIHMTALLFMANVIEKLGAFWPKFGTPSYSNWKYPGA